jgi:hypothetical protein
METVLRGITNDACLEYLYDLIIFGGTIQEHLLNLRKIFERFRELRLKHKPGKCQFLRKEIKYLGHIASPEKLKAVREWPTPKKKPQIRSFLGQHRKPLTRLTEENQAFQWTQEVEDTFQTVSGAFCAVPISSTPSEERDSSWTQTQVISEWERCCHKYKKGRRVS